MMAVVALVVGTVVVMRVVVSKLFRECLVLRDREEESLDWVVVVMVMAIVEGFFWCCLYSGDDGYC